MREKKSSWQCAQKVNVDIKHIHHVYKNFACFFALSLIFFFDSRSPKHNKLSKLSQLPRFLRSTEMRNLCVLHQNGQEPPVTIFKKARFSFIHENTTAACKMYKKGTRRAFRKICESVMENNEFHKYFRLVIYTTRDRTKTKRFCSYTQLPLRNCNGT